MNIRRRRVRRVVFVNVRCGRTVVIRIGGRTVVIRCRRGGLL